MEPQYEHTRTYTHSVHNFPVKVYELVKPDEPECGFARGNGIRGGWIRPEGFFGSEGSWANGIRILEGD